LGTNIGAVPKQPRIPESDRRILWEQFVVEHRKAYETLDSSVRTLSAGGIAVTVSLATALKTLSPPGRWAVGLFLTCLGLNLLSFVGVTLDMRARLTALKTNTGYEGAERSGWTPWISVTNVLACAALIAGGALLLVFIDRHAKG
jgi:hypothetical protein